jgi:ribosomal protein S18 acetylase RimI-like enzyme
MSSTAAVRRTTSSKQPPQKRDASDGPINRRIASPLGSSSSRAASLSASFVDRGHFELATGLASDHAAIQHLIGTIFPASIRDAFGSSLDDPFYEPKDRLIIRHNGQIVAHVHLAERVMHFGPVSLPTTAIVGLGTLPEFRGRGLARSLMTAAERAMRDDGAVLGLLSTRIPHFFAAHGWAVCGRCSHSRASTRDVLAHLSARGVPPAEGAACIRPWRQVELPGLMRLHAERTARSFGPLERTEAYWRWLISRQEFDQIFVALDGPDHMDWASLESPIAGYVVIRDDRILELYARPGDTRPTSILETRVPSIAEQLLARACGEAIERDYHGIQMHAAPDDPLHQLFVESSGAVTHHEAYQGEVFMARLLDAPGFVRRMADELQRRAVEGSLPRSVELGLCVDGQKQRLVVTRRSARLERGNLGRSYLRMNSQEFTRLMMGHLDVAEAVAQGRIESSTRLALEMAEILFPRVPYWRAPWDDLAC